MSPDFFNTKYQTTEKGQNYQSPALWVYPDVILSEHAFC